MDEIRVLQIGTDDWSDSYSIPEYVKWHTCRNTWGEDGEYDVVILDMIPDAKTMYGIQRIAKAYTFFVTEKPAKYKALKRFMQQKCGKILKSGEIQEFISNELRFYYADSYGEKYGCRDISIAQNFTGTVKWNGNYSVELSADFGDSFYQAAFWRSNILLEKGRPLGLWLEYKKEGGVELALKIYAVDRGSVSAIKQCRLYSEKELQKEIYLSDEEGDKYLMVSLCAKGEGTISAIALHARKSRGKHGCFLPGGERHVTSDREELFSYLDPGNLKPPLCVYFSGYKTKEGFEGYKMMRSMGCPFLLLSESRLEGGAFYLGSKEYESMVRGVITSAMKKLGFHRDDVILSGLSMGTHGAMYYACDIMPHAVIIGKPLLSLGDVAANEKLHRPGGFPTSLDLLQTLEHGMDEQAVQDLNERFWKRFEKADWHETKLVAAYMIEDDYDVSAYRRMVGSRFAKGTTIYGKGIHGRHNDDTNGIVKWFKAQYKGILRLDFRRTGER